MQTLSYSAKNANSEPNPGDVNLQEIYENNNFPGLNIIGAEYNGKLRVYILLAHEFLPSVYLAVYDIKREKIVTLRLIQKFSDFDANEKIVSAKAYLIDDNYVNFYLLTTHKVLCLQISNSNLIGRIFNKSETHILKETKNATMAVVSGYPFLAGGSLGGYSGNYIAYLGSTSTYYPYRYLHCARNNPILIQFQDSMYFIGGILLPKQDPLIEYHPLTLPLKKFSYYGLSIYQHAWRRNIIYPIISYDEINLRVDALNATALPYREEVYLFTKQSFYYERTFYRYNVLSNSWTIYELDKVVYQQRRLKKINSISSVNVNNMGYIFLSGNQGEKSLIETFKFKPFF